MDRRVDPWVDQGRKIFEKGGVGEIEFAGPMYQVEVFDEESGETVWPLLYFDQQTNLKDAMCGCARTDEGCPHLAAAYLRILDPKSGLPLHRQFATSFYHTLFQIIADHFGYDPRQMQSIGEGHYRIDAPIVFEIEALWIETKKRLDQMVQHRPTQTPENSIQFSELPSQELAWWKEGRPSAALQFALSFFSDVAKWCYLLHLNHPFSMTCRDDEEGLPTHLEIEGNGLSMKIDLLAEDLVALIPTLDTVDFPLKVQKEVSGRIKDISYHHGVLQIVHDEKPKRELSGGESIDGWRYQKGEGFYATKRESFFDRDEIPAQEVGIALAHYRTTLAPFLSFHPQPITLRHSLAFDAAWNLQIDAYLFEKNDLKEGSLIDRQWAYLEGKGFYQVREVLSPHVHLTISPDEMGGFIKTHRIWLSSRPGFVPHLASIDSPLTYRLEEGRMVFEARFQGIAEGDQEAKDFGDWIYYKDQGFFAKQQIRSGGLIRPGLTLPAAQISSFIKLNRDELDLIASFFGSDLPLTQRGVNLFVSDLEELVVEPTYTLLPEFQGEPPQFFGDFVYFPKSGFYELPLPMRLPEEYQQRRVIETADLHHFFSIDLPKLERHIIHCDPTIRVPCQADVHLRYLVRTPGGGVKVELVLVTELGEVSVNTLLKGIQEKHPVLFTEAGLIDLKDERFLWVKSLKGGGKLEESTLQMSTLEFIKLDAALQLLAPRSGDPQNEITIRLLKELREFMVSEPPNLRGLTSELRLYQQTGLQWLWFLFKNELSGLLCDDMGLGKTHQAMALMAAIQNKEEGRFLIVCPTSVIYHWQDKLEHFLPSIPLYTFHGIKRQLPTLQEGGILLTSYGVLRLQKEAIKKIGFDLAVYDEVQMAKNPTSQVHLALKGMNARMRLGLTGTPIENNLIELKALFDLVLPGYMPSEARFRDYFVLPIERELDETRKGELTQLIKPFVLRRRKREVLDELPEKSEDNAYCDLSTEQQEMYKEMLEQQREALVSQLRDREEAVPYLHVFSLLSKLKQICNHPALFLKEPENYEAHSSGKWESFIELLEEARRSDQKVVVFSQFLHMLDIIELYLRKQGWGYAQIRGDTVDRRGELKRFQEDPNCVVFIASLQAAGLGIDLTAASVVILYDRWWNAARENQAIDRVHRIGQKWAVQVFKLIAKGTIEEKIDRMILRKGQLMEQIVIADDQAMIKKFSRSDLIELLSFDEGENSEEPQ